MVALVNHLQSSQTPRSVGILLGIPHRKFHCLRHTFATNCIACGCDYKSLSQLLGHANVTTTMDLYVHPQMELKRQCVEHLAGLYV
ncbi:tyrosine-type recombinase/integrase [Faecalibaculum rodentium]|uniref:tyrosine-type recombinase/integrase n=1 Tax=Faecalibaculum rodentium TaxID=1702221 RepID=UPI00272A2532|nr:tyrosine-type recombinase/integrase [Faecalibaculum rodentium]